MPVLETESRRDPTARRPGTGFRVDTADVTNLAPPASDVNAELMTTELDHLLASLNSLRSSALSKLAGLSEDDARRSTVPSGTNLAGLIQHLTFVESKWIEHIVAGGKPSRGKRTMLVDPDVTLTMLRAEYRAAWANSDAIIREIGDPAAPIEYNGKTYDLRWAISAVIGETARHAGHADIIREQIDGKTGR